MSDSIIIAIAGLGIFLFGMTYLEDALKDASGRSFKRFLRSSTNTIPKSILTGALTTAALQSSSVVSLMTLSFVGAGIMQLSSGIGVIFGANIGTTFTAWIVAIVGFKVKVDAIALPMVGIGGLILVFFKGHARLNPISRIAIGFGLLFLGLEYMKDSTETFAKDFDLSAYLSYGAWVYVLLGFLLTAIIQSSSASTAIILSALNSNMIDFPVAAAMVIGSNVGTTVTALLGAIGGKADKKRVAIAHLSFNIGTGIIAYILLDFLSGLILETLDFKEDPTTALAFFHTAFNVMGVVVFSPFIPMLTNGLEKLFQKKPEIVTQYIDSVQVDVPDVALVALRKEALNFYDKTLRFGLMLFNISPEDTFDKSLKKWKILSKEEQIGSEEIVSAYRKLKRLEVQILEYASELGSKEISKEENKELTEIIGAVKEIIFAAKTLKDIKLNIETFYEEDNNFLLENYERYRERILKLFRNIHLILLGDAEAAEKASKTLLDIKEDNDQTIASITKAIKTGNISDELASSVLNANRSVFASSQSLFEALKVFQVKNVVEKKTELPA